MLFLDEVGETSPMMQVKLLRVLQDKKVRRLGGTDESEVDVRVIAATNRPLETLVKERRLREDLFYRLNVIPIRMPPLRERREDIPLLAEHFLRRFAGEMKKPVTEIDTEALARLERHSWPGNVRELENVIERAVALAPSSMVGLDQLPETVTSRPDRGGAGPELGGGFSLDLYLSELEARLVREALDQTAWDRQEACRLLGVAPRSLRYLIKKHAITPAKT